MIDLFVIFILNGFEKTGYQIRKEILQKFGTVSNTSFGSVHPVLKKFVEKKFLEVKTSFSEGGKRTNLYYLTQEGKKHFHKIFSKEISLNPATFQNEIFARFFVFSLATFEEKQNFLQNASKTVDFFIKNAEDRLCNQYLKLDASSQMAIKHQILQFKELKKFIERFYDESTN